MNKIDTLPTPALLLEIDRLETNIRNMQAVCDERGVELRPHIKTHKMVEVARRQLEAGARGLTCAKLAEAEAMVPSGVKSMFIAHTLVDKKQAARLRKLADSVDELIVACTSLAHVPVLEELLSTADCTLPVMMAYDTGLGREGARSLDDAVELAKLISAQPHMRLRGIYTHEGQLYGVEAEQRHDAIQAVHAKLQEVRDVVCNALGIESLPIWPGCSVSAAYMATLPEVDAVRPGAYMFGDLALTAQSTPMQLSDVALTILATVVDKPEPGLALIDAGSKIFSGDKNRSGISGIEATGRDITVVRCNEEHGYLRGGDVDNLQIGDRLQFVPAHVCPVVNLADEVVVVKGEEVVDRWTVDARNCVQ